MGKTINARKSIAVVGVAAAAMLVLAACGGSSGGDATPSQSTIPTPSSSEMVGGDPSTWAPVTVTQAQNGATFLVVPKQAGNFVDLPESKTGYFVTSSDEAAVTAVSSTGPETVPGFQAVAVGTSTVTVWDKDPAEDDTALPILEVTIQVAENTPAPAPSAS